jgi:hypothetical protein
VLLMRRPKPKPQKPQKKRARRWRSEGEVAQGITRLLQAMGKRDFIGGDLGVFKELEKELAVAFASAVERARVQGSTDGEIGKMLGVGRTAVSKRWPGHGQHLGLAERFWRARSDCDGGDPCHESGGGTMMARSGPNAGEGEREETP